MVIYQAAGNAAIRDQDRLMRSKLRVQTVGSTFTGGQHGGAIKLHRVH